MEILFPDDQSRHLYERKAQLDASFGNELGGLICCRLSMLRAADSLALVPPCRPIELISNGNGSYSVALGPSHRLEFCVPDNAGGRDVSHHDIRRIEIIGVVHAEA